jgi:transcriptional regulator with XRE-family HTH domain
MTTRQSVGQLLRDWRLRRRLSQLDFACEAEISTRHLSFIETGRSRPSREMLLRLAELLDIPLRDRNVLLTAGGFASQFQERSLDDPGLLPARRAIDLVLKGHEPYPAMVVDRHWNIVAANSGLRLDGVSPQLRVPPVNMLRLSLHPEGFAPFTLNLAEWRAYLLSRLRRQMQLTGDKVLQDLLLELEAYPAPPLPHGAEVYPADSVAVPLQYTSPFGTLSFIGTLTVFGTPIDITVSELTLDCLYPADARTAELLRMSAKGVD